MKIANKISLSFLVTAVILTGVGSPLFYIIAKKSLEDRIYAHLETTAQSRAHHIETYLEEHKKLTKILANDILLKNTLKAIIDNRQDSTSNIEHKEIATVDVVGAQLKEIIKSDEHFYEIRIMTLDGKIAVSTEPNNIGLDKSTHDCFVNGRKGLYVEDAHLCGERKREVIAAAVPILRDNTQEILGVLVAVIDLKSLYKITTDKTGLGETGEIYIVNEDGYMITPSRFKEDTFLKQKVDTLNVIHCRIHKDKNHISRSQALSLFRSYRGTVVLGTHAYIPEMQWYLCSEMDEKEAFASLAKIRFVFFITIICMPGAAGLIGIFVSRVISRPVRKLQKGAEIIGKGNLDYIVGTNTKDEIGQLSQAFDKMSADLKESHTKLEDSHKLLEQKVQERTAELSSANVKLAEEITERKQAEYALRESEGKLNSMLQSIGDHMSMLDKDLNILWANETARKMFGNDIVGKKCYEVYQRRKEPCDLSSCPTLGAFRDGKIHECDTQVIDKEGKIIYFHCTGNVALRDKEGKPTAVLEVSRNITERREAEEELKQSREFLNNTINALDDTFFVKDEEHRWTVLNDAACKAIGRPRKKLIGKSDYDLFPKEQAGVFWEKDNLVLETGETNVSEEEVTWQGKSHTISTKKSLFKDSITGKRFIVGTARDITERKQAEEALRESGKKYRALVEQSLQGIVILKDSRIVFANSKAVEIAGCTTEDFLAFSLEDMEAFIPPENRASTLERMKNRFDGKAAEPEYEIRLVRKNGDEFWLHLFFSPIEYDGKPVIQLAFIDITERKRAEEALRRSEIRFREIFENIAVGVYRTTPDGQILMANPALVHMLGYSSFEELSQRNLEEEGFEPQYRRSMFREEFERNGRIVSWESVWKARDGKKLYVIENARAIRDEDGKILYYEGTVENITERKKAEEALRESEQRYRAIFEQAADSILLIDAETGALVEFNDKAHKNLGYTREEFQNLKISDVEVIESAEETRKHLEKIIRTGADSFETIHRTKSGEIRDIQISSRPISIRDKDFVQSIWRDVTDRKKAEETMKVRARILENMVEGVNVADENCIIIFTNQKFDTMFGYKQGELIGKNVSTLNDLSKKENAELTKKIMTQLNTNGNWSGELINRRKDGTPFNTYTRISSLTLSGKNYCVSVQQDITEQKRVEQKLLEHQEQLKSLASQLTLAEERERRRIATELHDEISQSLFISKMKLESLHKSAPGKDFNETLEDISNSLGRIIAAMRSLTFDLSSPILYEFGFEEAVAEWLNEQVEKKHGIKTELEDDGSPKQLDDDIRVLLFRNVRELLINAIKHAKAKKIKVSIRKVDSRIRVAVEDDGVGFDYAKAGSMVTDKEAFGLFSIRERLEHFGGNLDIDSAPGCGCRVTITSPLRRENTSKGKQV
jgi:PAS domain S-box-containing protein